MNHSYWFKHFCYRQLSLIRRNGITVCPICEEVIRGDFSFESFPHAENCVERRNFFNSKIFNLLIPEDNQEICLLK